MFRRRRRRRCHGLAEARCVTVILSYSLKLTYCDTDPRSVALSAGRATLAPVCHSGPPQSRPQRVSTAPKSGSQHAFLRRHGLTRSSESNRRWLPISARVRLRIWSLPQVCKYFYPCPISYDFRHSLRSSSSSRTCAEGDSRYVRNICALYNYTQYDSDIGHRPSHFPGALTMGEFDARLHNLELQATATQDQLRESRDDVRRALVLLEAIAHALGIRHSSPAAPPSRSLSSAGNSPIASPVANLRGLSLRTTSVGSSAGSSNRSAHSSIIT